MPRKSVNHPAATERPSTAFILSLVGLVLQALGGLFVIFMMFYGGGVYWGAGMMMGRWMMGFWPTGLTWTISVIFAAAVALGISGVFWMNSGKLDKVRTGSVLVLVASIIAFPTMFGFMVGSILMFVGAILGLTWQPSKGSGA